MSWRRFALAGSLLFTAAVFLKTRPATEVLPAHESLASFPSKLGAWAGRDIPISADLRKVLGNGDFMLRVYRNLEPQPDINVFVAYVPTQQVGDTLHSPRNCLPGEGWSPLEQSRTTIALPERRPLLASRYLIGKSGQRQLVLYWYSSHGRTFASEYWAKFYLVADSIRFNRSDGSLVRIITPLSEGEVIDDAEQRLLNFSAVFVPTLDPYIAQ